MLHGIMTEFVDTNSSHIKRTFLGISRERSHTFGLMQTAQWTACQGMTLWTCRCTETRVCVYFKGHPKHKPVWERLTLYRHKKFGLELVGSMPASLNNQIAAYCTLHALCLACMGGAVLTSPCYSSFLLIETNNYSVYVHVQWTRQFIIIHVHVLLEYSSLFLRLHELSADF